MQLPPNTPFTLGTFSIAGCQPFPALRLSKGIVALAGLGPVCAQLGVSIHGASSMLDLLVDWEANFNALSQIAGYLSNLDNAPKESIVASVPFVSETLLRLHAPIECPRQIHCVGANYRNHLIELITDQGVGAITAKLTREQRAELAPKLVDARVASGTPYAFTALPSAVTGPFDKITLPKTSKEPDWELELGVIIGKAARNVHEDEALRYVAGYTVINDVTSRDLLYRNDMPGMDWLRGKCAPTFLPMGPYLVPAAFVPDPQNLKLTLKLNGEVMQNDSTADMLFSVAKQIEYLSRHVQLLPGDIIATGSPAGNGVFHRRYMKDGDILEGAIEGIGLIRNQCELESQGE